LPTIVTIRLGWNTAPVRAPVDDDLLDHLAHRKALQTMSEQAAFAIINIGTLPMNKFWGETERVRPATATCVLLQVGEHRVLVDPSPYPEELEEMLFARTGLRPGQVDQVFITHFHGDHRFGLDLFSGQSWVMASTALTEWRERSPEDIGAISRFLPAEEHLVAGLRLFPSPGHTPGHCSLQAETRWGSLIITGDAVMTQEYFDAEEGYSNSVDFAQAADTIRTIKRSAQLVIPGHGNLILNLD
jgi:glyoxylase-like metal-dependent hydrolase (beta-lactamase superfamily II)